MLISLRSASVGSKAHHILIGYILHSFYNNYVKYRDWYYLLQLISGRTPLVGGALHDGPLYYY